MKKNTNAVLLVVYLLAMAVLQTTNVYASINMGKIALKVGEESEVNVVSKSIFNSYTATSTWTKSNSTFTFIGKGNLSCTIKGNQVGTGKLYYSGYVAASGSTTTEHWDFYWDVEVKEPGPDPDEGGNGSTYQGEIPGDSWGNSGNYSISWYNKNATEFTISSNKDLAGVAFLVNNNYTNFEGKTIKLGADINLSGKRWIAVGKSNYGFCGRFDGQGHTIYGVFIDSQQQTDQVGYGFFGYMYKAEIVNTSFEGNIYMNEALNGNVYVGGIAGYASGSIKNCRANISLSVSKVKPSSFCVGGLVGYNYALISCCSHEGNIDIREEGNKCELPQIGGIAGYSNGKIEFSENLSEHIYFFYPRADHDNSRMRFGGIIGDGPGDVTCCRNIVDCVEIENKSAASSDFFVGGVKGNYRADITNSYSSISTVKFNSVSMYSGGIKFGGICADFSGVLTGTITASYSNSDVSAPDNNDRMTKGDDGSSSYSSAQMKTSAFLDELNLYSQLEMDGPVWSQEDGDYPYITALATSIEQVVMDSSWKEAPIYNLRGQRLTAPQKGVNIIGGKKVVVR